MECRSDSAVPHPPLGNRHLAIIPLGVAGDRRAPGGGRTRGWRRHWLAPTTCPPVGQSGLGRDPTAGSIAGDTHRPPKGCRDRQQDNCSGMRKEIYKNMAVRYNQNLGYKCKYWLKSTNSGCKEALARWQWMVDHQRLLVNSQPILLFNRLRLQSNLRRFRTVFSTGKEKGNPRLLACCSWLSTVITPGRTLKTPN